MNKDIEQKEDFIAPVDVSVENVKDLQQDRVKPTQRRLKSRHIAWIGLGGGIGVGLFIGSGAALARAGPLGTLLAYMITATIVWTVIQSLGEMATLIPSAGGAPHFVKRFLHPSVGFSVGWNYWYLSTTAIASELSAMALLIKYWSPINAAVWITVGFIPIVILNLSMVRYFGEVEVAMSSIKVLTFCGLIILGIILDLGGGPNHDRIGFRYWKNPGPFNHLDKIPGHWGEFLAFFSSFISAAFSYGGTESVIFAAGEASNPSVQIPRAARKVMYRIIFFYICGALLIGMLVPFNDPKLLGGTKNVSASPFVIAIRNAGIPALPSVFTAAVITSAWSAGNTYLYIGSRLLVSLSLDGSAPRIFSRGSKSGVPYYAVAASALPGLLAYLSAGSGGAPAAFSWLLALNGLTYLLLWGTYNLTLIRFRAALKAQNISVQSLTWYGKLQPYASWYATILCWFLAIFSGFGVFVKGHWNVSTFISNYISIVIFLIPMAGHWLYYRPKRLVLEEVDLYSGRIDPADEVAEPVPTTWFGRAFGAFI